MVGQAPPYNFKKINVFHIVKIEIGTSAPTSKPPTYDIIFRLVNVWCGGYIFYQIV